MKNEPQTTKYTDIPREEIINFQNNFPIGKQAFHYRLSVMALKYLDLLQKVTGETLGVNQ